MCGSQGGAAVEHIIVLGLRRPEQTEMSSRLRFNSLPYQVELISRRACGDCVLIVADAQVGLKRR